MLSIVLKILSILGILLLGLLGLAILFLLLVLFYPVSYKLTGKRDTEKMTASARVSWLFGLLRVSFDYPEPGKIFVKILPFTVFESGKGDKPKKISDSSRAERKQKQPEQAANTGQEPAKAVSQPQAGAEQKSDSDAVQYSSADVSRTQAEVPDKSPELSESAENIFFKKFKKIKYTIHSIYDKIINIWENISYYIDLLQEEESKLLFSHVLFRLGKILKSIRPGCIRGQILFGTGSPDTTGYAYGVYGMLSSFLGSRLLVTPDFTRAVLEGDIHISGHITVFIILWNGLKVLSDKKLKRFINKMKAGRKK